MPLLRTCRWLLQCRHFVIVTEFCNVSVMQDHEHLGSKGDIVEVKPGHARHTLFPKGEADYAVPSVIKQLKVGATDDHRLHNLGSMSTYTQHVAEMSVQQARHQLPYKPAHLACVALACVPCWVEGTQQCLLGLPLPVCTLSKDN